MSWVMGEALKLGLTIGMFAAVAFGWAGVHWVPFLVLPRRAEDVLDRAGLAVKNKQRAVSTTNRTGPFPQ